jgi:phasin family protein
MSTLPEQFAAARKSQVEAQINFFQHAAGSAVENAEKILALNINTTRATMETSSAAVRQLLAAQDGRELFALASPQAGFERLLAYGRQLLSIAGGSQAALLKQAAPVLAPSAPTPVAVPVVDPVVDPVADPDVDPVADPDIAPVIDPVVEPVIDPAVEPLVDLALQAGAELPANPTLAPEAKAAPAPALAPIAKAKPIAKAVSKVAPKALAAKPAAAPVPAKTRPLVVTSLKAVEAARPPAPASGKPAAGDKQLDLLAPKAKKKK